MNILEQRRVKMSPKKFVIYDKYNGHIVCDINNYKIVYKTFDSKHEAEQYIQSKNLNLMEFVVERWEKVER